MRARRCGAHQCHRDGSLSLGTDTLSQPYIWGRASVGGSGVKCIHGGGGGGGGGGGARARALRAHRGGGGGAYGGRRPPPNPRALMPGTRAAAATHSEDAT